MDTDSRGAGGKVSRKMHALLVSDIHGTRDQPVPATVMEDHGPFFLIERIPDAVGIRRKELIGLLDGIPDIRRHRLESIEQTPSPLLPRHLQSDNDRVALRTSRTAYGPLRGRHGIALVLHTSRGTRPR